jgi:cytochrome c oxidase subunit IV
MAQQQHDAHALPYRTYFMTWFWLLVMTMLALGLGYAPIAERLKAFLLVGTTLAKILLIAAVFMHLRYEKINLVMITIVPLILSIILFSFTFPETLGSSSHTLMVR